MADQNDLFDEPKSTRKKPGTRAPDQLSKPQMLRLHEWAETTVPWIRREALDSFESIDSYVEVALDHFRGTGVVKADWLATVRNWIRKDEKRRLSWMIRDGNDSARRALRDPVRWAIDYDRRLKILAASDAAAAKPAESIGATGGRVVSLLSRRPKP